jgi:hypothetical protein
MAADKTNRLSLLQNSTGPSPWYWNTFPLVQSKSGEKYVWTFHGEQGDLAYLVTLGLESESSRPRLALNTFCVPFAIEPNRLGIWCPEPGALRLMCFDPDQLAGFSFNMIVGWFKQSAEKVYSATEPVSELELSMRLPEGTHKIEVPEEFRTLDELLLVASRAAKTRDDAAASIFVLYPQAGLVQVLPQRWFTLNKYEVGKQWIARVVRDPETQRLLGDGVRMGSFQLTEDGGEIEEWMETSSI